MDLPGGRGSAKPGSALLVSAPAFPETIGQPIERQKCPWVQARLSFGATRPLR